MLTLSDREVTIFLEDVLCINDAELKFKDNKLALLREILRQFLHFQPFQNIISLSTKSSERRLPTFDEIKDDLFQRKGGRCYSMNQFIKVLLEKIGYDVYHTSCAILKSDNNHLCTFVRDLTKPGDLHLADVGIAYPTWDPISLNFEQESPVYHVGFLYFKFIRKGNIITRLHKHDKSYECPVNIDSKAWHEFMDMPIIPRDLEYIKPTMTEMYTIPGAHGSPFLMSLRCIAFKDDKIFGFKDATFLYENDEGQLVVEEMSSCEELVAKVSTHFPQYPKNMVKDAVESCKFSKFE